MPSIVGCGFGVRGAELNGVWFWTVESRVAGIDGVLGAAQRGFDRVRGGLTDHASGFSWHMLTCWQEYGDRSCMPWSTLSLYGDGSGSSAAGAESPNSKRPSPFRRYSNSLDMLLVLAYSLLKFRCDTLVICDFSICHFGVRWSKIWPPYALSSSSLHHSANRVKVMAGSGLSAPMLLNAGILILHWPREALHL